MCAKDDIAVPADIDSEKPKDESGTAFNTVVEISTVAASAAGMISLATAVLPLSSTSSAVVSVAAAIAGGAIGAWAGSPRRRKR